MTLVRLSRLAARAAIAVVTLAACATRRPEGIVTPAPISATPVWRLEAGDVIRTRFYREPELASETIVNATGEAYFPALGRVRVAGLSLDSLQAELAARYGRVLVEPALDATMLRDLVVYGQVRTAGIFPADQGTTVLGLVAKAGGASGPGRTPILTLIKGDGRQFRLSGATRLSLLDVVHGDAVYVQDDTFIGRNSQNLSTIAVLVSLTVSLLSIIVAVTR